MKKLFTTLLLMFTIFLGYGQTSKAEIKKIIKEQSDGIPGQSSDNSTAYEDGKNAVTTVYSDVKSLSPKVTQAVQSLANSLKTTANQLWIILVKQQFVWSCAFLILTIISVINWILFYRRMYPSIKKIEYDVLTRDIIGEVLNPGYDKYYAERHPEDNRALRFIKGPVGGKEEYFAPKIINKNSSEKDSIDQGLHFALCVVISGFSAYHFPKMLTGFINPEYGALQTILEVANSLK